MSNLSSDQFGGVRWDSPEASLPPSFEALGRQFQYPKDMDDESVSEHVRQKYRRVHEAFGSGDLDALFSGSSGAVPVPAPWPGAGRLKDRSPYDAALVRQAVSRPDLTEVDPRHLHATQSSITRGGVEYYMGDEWERSGTTFGDQGKAGNRYPFVYAREDGENLLLAGHHRAAAALLRGRPLVTKRVEGPWGTPHGQ